MLSITSGGRSLHRSNPVRNSEATAYRHLPLRVGYRLLLCSASMAFLMSDVDYAR